MVAAACIAALAPSIGIGAALLCMACLLVPVAWIALLGRSRTILVDPERRMLVVRWRSALFRRRQAELPLERFAHVVSYHPFATPPAIVVALVERTGDRELVVAGFSAAYRGRSFWSLPRPVEGQEARQLRTTLAARLGLADGGYRGMSPRLRPSEAGPGR